jgi:hypothetical protein
VWRKLQIDNRHPGYRTQMVKFSSINRFLSKVNKNCEGQQVLRPGFRCKWYVWLIAILIRVKARPEGISHDLITRLLNKDQGEFSAYRVLSWW